MRNVCDAVVEVLRTRSAEAPLNLEEILSHVIVLGALDRTRPHDTTEISNALTAEMRRRAETHLPQRFTTADGAWWALVDPPPAPLRPAGRGWMAQLARDVRWRGTTIVGHRLESFRYEASSATALLRASQHHGDGDVTLAGQVVGTLVVPRLRGGLRVTADVEGDVIIEGPVAGDVTISGQVAGSVHVRGPIDGTLHIASAVHRGVRITASHIGRIDFCGQIGGAVHIAARIVDGVAVSGWVADDLTIAGTVAGGIRIAADISGRLTISKRVIGNVKAGGWILGGIDVSGPIDGGLTIQSWVGSSVSITAPVASVDLGSGRFYGSIKLRPEGAGTGRTTLTSIRLAEFHAPVRIHSDVDTTAVDTTGAVGRSQLRCIGSNRRPFDQDVGRKKARSTSPTVPRAAQPIDLVQQTPLADARPEPVNPNSAMSIKAQLDDLTAEGLPWLAPPEQKFTDETAPGAPGSGEPQSRVTEPIAGTAQPQKLPVADTPLTLAELAQQRPAEPSKAKPLTPRSPTRKPPTQKPPTRKSIVRTEARPTMPSTPARFTQAVPIQAHEQVTTIVPTVTSTIPAQTLASQTITAPSSESEPEPQRTEQLVLSIPWLD